jgi:hypothetical protein
MQIVDLQDPTKLITASGQTLGGMIFQGRFKVAIAQRRI